LPALSQGAIRGLRESLDFLLPTHLRAQINAKYYSCHYSACQLLSLKYTPSLRILSQRRARLRRMTTERVFIHPAECESQAASAVAAQTYLDSVRNGLKMQSTPRVNCTQEIIQPYLLPSKYC
jgi:hypothetical protein